MDVDELIDDVIGREGGYSNHPADRGGPTRWGITEAVARAHGFAGDMRDFPREDAASASRDGGRLRPRPRAGRRACRRQNRGRARPLR